ncbi:UNVERIFIED_CONTAM: hypothetical protein FKN15_071870 [Acipenser sinensis]
MGSSRGHPNDPEVLDTNDPMWSVVERAARHLGVDWPASEPTRRSLFELPSAHTLQSRILPAFPDFIKEVQSTWGAPASTPATSRKAAAFNMHGASEAGLASFPPVGAAFAALVKAPTLSGLAKDPSCPNRQCRITEAHLKKGYAAATEAVRLSNVASLLTVYQAALLRDLPECPSAALRTELGTVAQLLVKLAQLNARAQGRSIASLVVARRQLWLSQARVQEPDKVPLLDAPISPGHTFGPAVEEMLQRSVKAREASQQLAKMWPSKPFQPRRPQERQWRRAPPQQQAQSRGSMTAPSGVSARGQPAFVRPQRGGWRPRGGGKPRPRGSGQAPRHRAVRLAGGRDSCAGRVEVWEEGFWGTVCDDWWDVKDGDVACAQVGCGFAVEVLSGGARQFGNGHGPILMDDVNCTGTERFLWECPVLKHSGDCGHKEDAGVICSEHKAIRLSGGLDRCSGRVEIHRNGSWGTVCDSLWGKDEGGMVCSMLGCGDIVKVRDFNNTFKHDTTLKWFYQCTTIERSLWDCKEYANNPNLCQKSSAAAVVCSMMPVQQTDSNLQTVVLVAEENVYRDDVSLVKVTTTNIPNNNNVNPQLEATQLVNDDSSYEADYEDYDFSVEPAASISTFQKFRVMDVTVMDVTVMDVTVMDVTVMVVTVMDVTLMDVTVMDVTVMDVTMIKT